MEKRVKYRKRKQRKTAERKIRKLIVKYISEEERTHGKMERKRKRSK